MLERYKGRKWVIGVSGGIDSMSLLDMAFEEGLEIVVCHVNYQKRKSAYYDEMVVESYCKERHIPYFAAHAGATEANYNFQAWAREYRYSFYHAMMEKEQCDGVLLAHHADDFLETALLREKQGRMVSFYGIKAENQVNGMLVCRPLLHHFKIELAQYLKERHLEYGQDETNFENHYERNQIRNLFLANKTLEEKRQMLAYYESMNAELEAKHTVLHQELTSIMKENALPLPYLKQRGEARSVELMREWLVTVDVSFYEVSGHFLSDVYAFLFSKKKIAVKEIGNYVILKEYDYLKVIEKKSYDFCYVLEKRESLDTPYFHVVMEGTLKEGITVSEEDFPLTIRNVKEGDAIAFQYGHKNIHQYFIERKIPYEERQTWPIVVNRSGEVIFVCNLGSNITHFTNKPNLFVVK